MFSFLMRLVTWWNGQTLGTQLYTWRKGVGVGEDAEGNIFYQSAMATPLGDLQRREAEASRVSPGLAWMVASHMG